MVRGITETDVWQAADALLLAGDRPTIERVRQQLGRGSPNTVSPHLDTWFRGLGTRMKEPQAFAAPAAVPNSIQQAAVNFWQVALSNARTQVDSDLASERNGLAETQRQLEEARLELGQEEERQAARREGMVAAMRVIETQLQSTNNRVASSQQQLAESARGTELLQAQCTALANDKDAIRFQLEGERASHEVVRLKFDERAAANEQRWGLELDRAREATKRAQGQLTSSEKLQAEHLSTLNTARERLEADLAMLTNRSAGLQIESDQAKAALSKAERNLEALSAAAAQREAALLSQTERIQDQLSGALDQLRAKDAEQGALLRSLLESSNGDGKRTSAHQGRPSKTRTAG